MPVIRGEPNLIITEPRVSVPWPAPRKGGTTPTDGSPVASEKLAKRLVHVSAHISTIIKRVRSASVHTDHDMKFQWPAHAYIWYVWAGQDGEEFHACFFNAVAFY